MFLALPCSPKGFPMRIQFSAYVLLFLVVLTSEATSGEMTFDIIYNNHTNIIVGDGEITSETPVKFQEFLDSDRLDGFRFIVHLNSEGGNLYGGMELGRMIRNRGFSTDIVSYEPRSPGEEWWHPRELPGQCWSACAIAFLGGERRQIKTSSVIGFHQFSSNYASADSQPDAAITQATTQIVSSAVLDYIIDMGGSVDLFLMMSTALPNEMFIPDEQQQKDFQVISRTAFRDFDFEPYRDGVIAYSIFPENVEGRQIVYQLTTYCKNNTPYLLLSGSPNFQGLKSEWIESVAGHVDGFSIWSNSGGGHVDYPTGNIAFRANSRVIAEIRIDHRGVEILLNHGQGSINLPGVYGYFFAAPVEATQEDKEKIQSSFRHCISGN